jgi:hypothetical protein
VGVSLLTMDAPALVSGATVLVAGGRIQAINPQGIPAAACRVEGAGRVLMPGLADMHVHTDERELPLFLANGVTLVREMNGSPTHLALRERVASGALVGPRMLVASPLLAGVEQRFRHTMVSSAEDAFRVAHEIKAAGYDYLKIYDGLSREAYEALVEAGRTLGLPLDGHIPHAVGLRDVLANGQRLQHTEKIAMALAGHSGDTTRLADARRLFREYPTWVTPTLAVMRVLDAMQTTEYAAWLERPELAYVDAGSLAWWRSLAGTRSPRPLSPYFRFQAALVPVLRDAGTPMLLGTDAANPMMVAGFSVHDELAALVEHGGLTSFEALVTSTVNVGRFLGDTLQGRLVVGAPADLVLVNGDPLADLARLRRPEGVMVRGRWLPREELDAMLLRARRP